MALTVATAMPAAAWSAHAGGADAAADVPELVSLSSAGEQATRKSTSASISRSERYVAFVSGAPNLVPGDTNGRADVFVRDVVAGTTTRVSVSSDEAQADKGVYLWNEAPISADGRYLTFTSRSTNLVRRDDDRNADFFVRDLREGLTMLVSVRSDERQVRGGSYDSRVSANGRRVCFATESSRLARPDVKPGVDRVVVRDLRRGTTMLAGPPYRQDAEPTGACSLSRTGRFVAFSTEQSLARRDRDDNVDVYVRDLRTGHYDFVSQRTDGRSPGIVFRPEISASGRYVVFDSRGAYTKGDTNRRADVFVRDRVTRTTERVSVDADLAQVRRPSWNGSISADGRQVSFFSAARLTGDDTNSDSDFYAVDLDDRVVVLASKGTVTNWQDRSMISPGGSAVVFLSGDGDVPGDENGKVDVFLTRLSWP